jgi:ParB-like chromosome segregation protein Spo0J
MLEPKEMPVALDLIEVGDRMRKPDRTVITDLAASMVEHGQLQRIGLRARDDGRYDLIWGRNRLEAAGQLTRPTIDARVYPADTPDELLETLEIVENLNRQELTVEERAAQRTKLTAAIRRRREKLGHDTDLPKTGRGHKGVIQEAAEQLGVDHSSIRRDLKLAAEMIGENVDPERDSSDELERKAIAAAKAAQAAAGRPKLTAAERRARKEQKAREQALAQEAALRDRLREGLERMDLDVAAFCALGDFWGRALKTEEVEAVLSGASAPAWRPNPYLYRRQDHPIAETLDACEKELAEGGVLDLTILKEREEREQQEQQDESDLGTLKSYWDHASERVRREFREYIDHGPGGTLAEESEQTSETEVEVPGAGEPETERPDGPTEVGLEGNGAEPPIRICAEPGCDEVLEVPAGKRGRPPTRCSAHRRPARDTAVDAEGEAEQEGRP